MKNVSFKLNQFHPPMIVLSLFPFILHVCHLCSLLCLSACFHSLSSFLSLSQTHTYTQNRHTLKRHSVLTFTDTFSDECILAEYYCFLSSNSVPHHPLLFMLSSFHKTHECHNLEGEMISSRAFSCWIKHESLSLYSQLGCSLWDC